MNNYEDTQDVGLNAADFLGNYLKKEDLAGETLVTLTAVRAEIMPGTTRQKLVAQFEEFQKPLILNATNIRRLTKLFGSSNTARWRGSLTLYVDEYVEYAGQPVGGIRIKPAANGAARRAEPTTARPAQSEEDVF